MTEKISGEHGIKSEDRTEEILNQTFFKDFTFRNPRKDDKYKKPITDVLVCFDDVVLIVESKSQGSTDDPNEWLPSNLQKAIRQVSGAIRYLKEKGKVILNNKRRGDFEFDIKNYKYIYGLVIINQPDNHKIDISNYKLDFLKKHNHPLQIISLKDFNRVCYIFDTAEEVLHYYDVRNMMLTTNKIYLHDEERFIDMFVNNFTQMSKRYRQFINVSEKDNEDEHLFIQERYYKAKHSGIEIDDYEYGEIIDDLIDHCHNFDPNLYNEISIQNVENIINPKQYYLIAHELAKTGRLIRILHGQKIMGMVHEAKNEGYKKEKDLTLISESRKTAYHYYIPNIDIDIFHI
jgi:hypothetical protein